MALTKLNLSNSDIASLTDFNLSHDDMPSGSILQVKHHTIDPGTQSTTSLSLVESGLTVSITPKASTSKFLILVSMHEIYIDSSNKAIGIVIAKNGTPLNDTDRATLGFHGGGVNYFNVNLHAYDAPNTTSEITYSVQVKSTYGSSVRWNGDNTPTFLTVMEIAG
jgi:hypothetical protein